MNAIQNSEFLVSINKMVINSIFDNLFFTIEFFFLNTNFLVQHIQTELTFNPPAALVPVVYNSSERKK